MEPDDPKLIEFLKTVFHDMRMRDAETNALNLSSPERVRAKPYAKFKRQLYVMYRALDPMHRAGLETLFRFLPLNSSNAFSLMSAHCSAVWEECTEENDIFLHLMYTCSFTYSLLAFCENNGHYGILYLFPRWIAKIYIDLIEPKFKDATEWVGLDIFCSSRNLHLILDFINLCYSKQGKLFTYITLGNSYFFYGLHNDDTLLLLKNNFPNYKKSILAEFKDELDDNMVYKGAVMLAFIKMELAFDDVANVFNPPSPTRRLLYPTIDFFKRYMCDTLRYEKPKRINKLLIKQGRIRAEQERDRVRQERARVEQERARVEQERAQVEEERARIEQERVLIEQERVRVIQEQIRFIQKRTSMLQNQAHSAAEKTSSNIEQIPISLEEAISNIQQSIKTMTLKSSIKKNAPQVAEIPDNEEHPSAIAELDSTTMEQYPADIEQDPTVIEQDSAAAEHTVEHSLHTLERMPDNAEQAHAAKELVPTANEHSLGAGLKISKIRTVKPLFRVILVKEPPDDVENVSDAEKEACHSCCCHKKE